MVLVTERVKMKMELLFLVLHVLSCACHALPLEVPECWMDSFRGLLVTNLIADSTGALSYE